MGFVVRILLSALVGIGTGALMTRRKPETIATTDPLVVPPFPKKPREGGRIKKRWYQRPQIITEISSAAVAFLAFIVAVGSVWVQWTTAKTQERIARASLAPVLQGKTEIPAMHQDGGVYLINMGVGTALVDEISLSRNGKKYDPEKDPNLYYFTGHRLRWYVFTSKGSFYLAPGQKLLLLGFKAPEMTPDNAWILREEIIPSLSLEVKGRSLLDEPVGREGPIVIAGSGRTQGQFMLIEEPLNTPSPIDQTSPPNGLLIR